MNAGADTKTARCPHRRNAGKTTPRTLALVAGGAAVAVVLLVALFQVRLGAPPPEEPEMPADFTPLIPRAPVEGDVSLDPLDGDRIPMLPDLDEGGWIEAYDRDSGRLAQRYRFERLDPSPPNLPAEWAQFTKPHVEVYSEGGRVLLITADTAMVHRPHGLLKSGRLVGNVTIRQFETPGTRTPNLSRDTPTLLVRTARADFDNFLGQVRADGSFRIEAPTAEFMGSALTILINDRDQHIQELAVAEVEFVRFTQGLERAAREDDRTAPARPAAPADERGPPAAESAPAPPATPQVVFYRLTLRENVRVEDGTRTLTGDTLRVVFSNESEALGGAFARAPAPPRRVPATAALLAAALGYQPPAAPPTTLAPPRSPDDVWITCSGGLLMVPETDAAELPASPRDTRLTLQGAPARLRDATEGRELAARCGAMVYEALERTVRLVGTPGSPLEIESERFNAEGETFYYRDTDARGGFTGPGTLTLVGEEQDLDVEWNRSVDLAFAPGGGDEGPGALERAVFRGRAVAAGDGGRIGAETLDLGLALNEQGETVPATLLAEGEVRAEDPQRTIWADRLEAEFADDPRPDAGAGALGAAPIERFSATGAVQVALGRDGRLFADRIDGTEGGARVVAAGAPLMVAQGGWLLDKGNRLVLDETAETAHWDGPGRARVYADPLLAANERRTVPPTPTAEPRLVATWAQSLLFDAAAREGAGDVHLTGAVRVDSSPEPSEHSTLEGDEVTLELVAGEHPPAAGQEAGAIGEDRALDRIIARGEARLESRRWEDARREGPARLFFIAGPELAYRQPTGDGEVVGPAEILVQDLRPPPPQDASAPGDDGPLLARGTTTFKCSDGVVMTGRDDGLHDLRMTGAIEMRHLGLEDDRSTLSCSTLHAVVDRTAPAAPSPEAEGETPGQLRALRAEGSVFMRTPERDVICEVFDYDLAAGVAELRAAPGTVVTVHAREGRHGPHPMRFEHGVWDLQRDRITVRRAAGGG